MATKTSVAAGGAWSAGATWVGGVVPALGDDIVIDSPSGTVTMDTIYASYASITHTRGGFSTASKNFAVTSFASSNSNARSLDLGSSVITLTASSGYGWDTSTATNLTVTANTATIAFGNSAMLLANGQNLNGATVTFAGSVTPGLNTPSGTGCTVANLTITGPASKTGQFTANGPVTVTGTFTANGNSATNRLLVSSNTLGTARTITAAAVSLSNVDFMDVTGAGAASWTGTSLGDCGGNSGITFTPSVIRYGVVAGNWSSTATWSATSGGAGGASVPLPQDDVILDASSAAGTYTIDMPRIGRNLTATNFARTLSWGSTWSMFGSLTLSAGMTTSGNPTMTLSGRGTHTITTAGKALRSFTIAAPGGTYTQADALVVTTGGISVNYGTLTTANYSVTTDWMTVAGTVNLGSSVVTLTTAGPTAWFASGTINAGTSTIVLTDTSAATKTFAGGSKAYGALTIQGGPSNAVAITGANTWDRINVPAGCVLTFPSSTTQTFTGPGIVSTGAPRRGIRFSSSGSGYVSTPDEAGLTPASSLSARFAWALDDWTPAVGAYLGSHYTSSPNKAWLVAITTAGLINFVGSSDGTNVSSITSTVAPTLTDGAAYCIRADWATSGTVTFSTKPYISQADMALDTGWTQTGTPVASGLATLANAAVAFQIAGHSLGSSLPTGEAFGALLRVDGNVVVNVDLTAKPFGADSFVCATGQTVTVNGDLACAGDGRVLLNSATLGTTATISKSGGQMVLPFTTVKDITFSGGAAFIAPPPSVLVSNTSGIRNGARYGISADGTQFFKY